MKHSIVLCLLVCHCLSSALANAVHGAAPNALAKMRAPQNHPVLFNEIKTYLQTVQQKRAFNEQETSFQHLVSLADLLKVEQIFSRSPSPDALDSHALMLAIKDKITLHPTWDNQLSPTELNLIKPNATSLQKSFGAKSYVSAWILKQMGNKDQAKAMLSALANEGHEKLMEMRTIHFGNNPLPQLEYVHQALVPMSSEAEQRILNERMQKMKKHISNLPDSMMMTSL